VTRFPPNKRDYPKFLKARPSGMSKEVRSRYLNSGLRDWSSILVMVHTHQYSVSNKTQGKTSESSTRIREQLKALRSDEVASIAQNVVRQGTILQQEIAWFRNIVIGNTVSLVVYMARTWVNIFVGYVERYTPLPIGTNSSSPSIDA
jgi:hypothetical protein